MMATAQAQGARIIGRQVRGRNRTTGFTLIEVLVAISITVVVAGMAYAFLDSAIDASQSTEAVVEDVNELETVWQVLATDIHHMIDRELPASIGGPGNSGSVPTFMGGDPALSGTHFLQGNYTLRFVRDGWANPLHQLRSDMQRVGYRWRDGELWREYWAERNQPYDTEPTGRRLLAENITAIRIRFLHNSADGVSEGPWVDTWPPSRTARQLQNTGNLPAALEITLTREGLGDVHRIFALPGA